MTDNTPGALTAPAPSTAGRAADLALGVLSKGGEDTAAIVLELDAIRMELRTANLIALLNNRDFAESRYNLLVSLILEGLDLA